MALPFVNFYCIMAMNKTGSDILVIGNSDKENISRINKPFAQPK
jgi:hypothetical protein